MIDLRNRCAAACLLAGVVGFLGVPHADAGEPVVVERVVPLTSNAALGGDRAVALLDNWLFVGDNRDQEQGFRMGAVTVYRRVSGGWSMAQKLLPTAMPATQQFGHSVAADQDPESGEAWLIVGAPAALSTVTAGRVYLYKEDAGAWGDPQILESPNGAFDDDWFGWDVDIDVSVPHDPPGLDPIWTAAIGAPRYALDLAPNRTGSLLITTLNSLNLWMPAEPPIAIETTAGLFSDLGWSVAIAGDRAFAGAPAYDPVNDGTTIGAVHRFARGAQLQWAGNGRTDNPDPNADTGDRYGLSVDIAFQPINSGYDYVIGAPGFGDFNQGAVYIESGIEVVRLERETPTMFDEFGFAVAIEDAANGDNRVFASSPTFDTGERGSVLEYRRALITEPWDLFRQYKLIDAASGQPGQSASMGRDLAVHNGDIALTARPAFGGAALAVYTSDVPLFVGNFELSP